MTIGLSGRADPREVARLYGMLRMSFRGVADGYAINRRRWPGQGTPRAAAATKPAGE